MSVVLVKTGNIPKTSSGKIRRSTCRAKFLQETLAVVDSVPQPETCQETLTFQVSAAV